MREEISWKQEQIVFAKVKIAVNLEASLPNDVKMVRMQNFASWLFDPLKIQLLAKEGKKVNVFQFIKEVGKFFIPDADFDKLIGDDESFISPAEENILMLGGKFVEPKPSEDFKEHLEMHQTFMQVHPVYQGMPPNIQQMFMQHVELTKQVMQEQEKLAQQKPGASKPVSEGVLAGGAVNVQGA